MKKNLADYLSMPIQDATELELFNALLNLVTDSAAERGYNEGRKKLYYISAEFLIGKLLSNNLINLGLYDDVRAELEAAARWKRWKSSKRNRPWATAGSAGSRPALSTAARRSACPRMASALRTTAGCSGRPL